MSLLAVSRLVGGCPGEAQIKDVHFIQARGQAATADLRSKKEES
jgi:hypothetical protein